MRSSTLRPPVANGGSCPRTSHPTRHRAGYLRVVARWNLRLAQLHSGHGVGARWLAERRDGRNVDSQSVKPRKAVAHVAMTQARKSGAGQAPHRHRHPRQPGRARRARSQHSGSRWRPCVLASIRSRYPAPHLCHAGDKLRKALKRIGEWTIEIIKRSDTAQGFEALPRRWVVERTFAWLGRCRRLAKDFEATIASAVAWALVAHIRTLTRRLARS